jgi:hypothetical protein
MPKIRISIAATAAAAALVLALGAPSANAYGTGYWSAQPYGCNAGTFSGFSQYNNSNGLVNAETAESGNFCWFGNTPVGVQVHDQYRNSYGYFSGANWASADYYTGVFIPGWGGFHNWGNSGAQST